MGMYQEDIHWEYWEHPYFSLFGCLFLNISFEMVVTLSGWRMTLSRYCPTPSEKHHVASWREKKKWDKSGVVRKECWDWWNSITWRVGNVLEEQGSSTLEMNDVEGTMKVGDGGGWEAVNWVDKDQSSDDKERDSVFMFDWLTWIVCSLSKHKRPANENDDDEKDQTSNKGINKTE